MLTVVHESHLSLRKLVAHAFHLARSSAGIETPVKKQRWHAKLAQSSVVKILIRAMNHVRDPQPDSAVSARHVLPMVISMVLPEQFARFFSEVFRMRRKPFKKTSRVWFVPEEVKRFENQRLISLCRSHSEHRANHCAVTVAPENRALDSECVQKGHRLLRSSLVKIQRHLAGHARRAPVPRPVRDQNPELALKCFDLPFERIQPISPAAMKKNERPTVPELPIVNFYWADLRRVRRICQLHKRHQLSLSRAYSTRDAPSGQVHPAM